MGSCVRGGAQASFTRMAWSWTGYDYDPVFRYKDAEPTFFQTGRNNAEARFWQTKIHEGDRRGTKSQIEIGSDGDSVKDHADVTKASSEDSASKDGEAEYEEDDDVRSLGDRDYQYRDPGQRYFVYEETRHDGHKGRDRTMSIVSTISRKDDWRSPSKDYQYSYGEDAVEVERPPTRGSVERQRSSVERQRGSVERKVKRQSEERPRQSEERSWQSVERPRQSEERPRQSNERPRQTDERPRQADERPRQGDERPRQTDERPRQTDERYRQPEGTKREERQREPTERRSEEYERYKEPDEERRYKREVSEADERCIERRHDHDHERAEDEGPERVADWDRRPNVNRRKVHGHRGQPCAPGGDFTGSSYY